jgi:hypothetical protein
VICREELPRLQKLIGQFKDRQDVVFLSLNLDDNPGLINPWVAELKLTLTVLPAYSYANDTLKIEFVPQNWLVGPDGIIRLKGIGYDASDKWEQAIKDAIEKAGRNYRYFVTRRPGPISSRNTPKPVGNRTFDRRCTRRHASHTFPANTPASK